jgi:hypothetical protein
MKKCFASFLNAILCAIALFAQPAMIAGAPVQGAWLGQSLPGTAPVPFAKELFATISPFVETCDFSPDGSVCVISVGSANYSSSRLLWSRQVGGKWAAFEPAPFAAGFAYANEPVFARDGKSLVFTGSKSTGTKDFWAVSYSKGSWGEPAALPEPVNSSADEFRPCFQPDGTIWFVSSREGGMNQLYKATKDGSGRYAVAKLPPSINTGNWECDPCVPADGRFLLFFSAVDQKSTDMYLVFPDGKGGWGPWIKAKPGFNTGNDEYGAHLTADGAYLFFTRHSATGNTIYWVSVSAIDALRG